MQDQTTIQGEDNSDSLLTQSKKHAIKQDYFPDKIDQLRKAHKKKMLIDFMLQVALYTCILVSGME